MFKSRMLDNVRQSRHIPPIWLAILISIAYVYGGGFLAFVGMMPIGFVIGFVTSLQGGTAATQEFLAHYALFFQLSTFFFISLTVFFRVRFIEKRRFSSLGFFREGWLRELGRGFLIGVAQFSVVAAILLLTGIGHLEWAGLTLEPFLFIIALLPFWIVQGGTEELITRGWLLPMVSARSNVLIGVLVSSLLFGVMHIFNPGVTLLSILNVILYGVFAAFLMLKYDNMWVLAGAHGAWNFVQGNVYGIQVSGQNASAAFFNYSNQSSIDWLSGGAFGAEGSVITSLVLLACIGYLYWSMKKAGSLPAALDFRKSS